MEEYCHSYQVWIKLSNLTTLIENSDIQLDKII